jgi:GR25 family glycosyltransferase involved in LPS biosynthesis
MGGIIQMELMEESFSSKICVTVFHIETNDLDKDSLIRRANANNTKKYLKDKCLLLDSRYIEINEKQDLLSFIEDNDKFKIDPRGFDFVYGQKSLKYNKKEELETGWVYQELGELASIYLACKEFLNTSCEYLLTVQDDIILHNNFYELLSNYLKELPENFDAFFQYVPNPGYPIPKHSTDTENITFSYQYGSTACFVLSRSGATKLIEHFENAPGVNLCISWFILKSGIFNCYSLRPNRDQGCRLVIVNPLVSDHVLTLRAPLNYLNNYYNK